MTTVLENCLIKRVTLEAEQPAHHGSAMMNIHRVILDEMKQMQTHLTDLVSFQNVQACAADLRNKEVDHVREVRSALLRILFSVASTATAWTRQPAIAILAVAMGAVDSSVKQMQGGSFGSYSDGCRSEETSHGQTKRYANGLHR